MQETHLIITDEFKEKVKAFKKDFSQKYHDISTEDTPKVDGNGKKIVEKRPDGYDYITEAYMRECLDRHFPGWSWEAAAPLHFLGAEWVVAQGHLVIIDEHLFAFNVNPPTRKFFGVDSVRIQFKRDSEHVPANIIDVGDSCKSANSAALKYAINRLCHIGDDIYGKRIEYEGAGSYETILEANPNGVTFGQWVTDRKWSWADIIKILGVKSMTEVTDYKEAVRKVKEAKSVK